MGAEEGTLLHTHGLLGLLTMAVNTTHERLGCSFPGAKSGEVILAVSLRHDRSVVNLVLFIEPQFGVEHRRAGDNAGEDIAFQDRWVGYRDFVFEKERLRRFARQHVMQQLEQLEMFAQNVCCLICDHDRDRSTHDIKQRKR